MFDTAAAVCQFEGAYLQDKKGLSIADFKYYDSKIVKKKMGIEALETFSEGFKDLQKYDSKTFSYRWRIDFYNRYKEDLKLFKQVGINCFKTSITWARIFSKSDGIVNNAAIEHYKEIFREAKKMDISLVLTLSHYDHPLWLLEEFGGFENKKKYL